MDKLNEIGILVRHAEGIVKRMKQLKNVEGTKYYYNSLFHQLSTCLYDAYVIADSLPVK